MNIDSIAENYENLAESWAIRLDTPFATKPHEVVLCIQLINAIWRDVYPEVLECIEINPHEFAERVGAYRLAINSEVQS